MIKSKKSLNSVVALKVNAFSTLYTIIGFQLQFENIHSDIHISEKVFCLKCNVVINLPSYQLS